MSPARTVSVAVPVKGLCNAKQRLSPLLSPAERRGLFEAMVTDVLLAVRGAPGVDEVLVVTCDPEAKQLAHRLGVGLLEEPAARGHTEAVRYAAQVLVERGVETLMTVPGDIPLIVPGEVSALIEAHAPGPSVTITPARDERGSNAVLCTPPDALPLRFGDDSFLPHLAQARRIGIEPRVVPQPGIGLDIDVPEDLSVLVSLPSSTRAHAFLERHGIVERCFSMG